LCAEREVTYHRPGTTVALLRGETTELGSLLEKGKKHFRPRTKGGVSAWVERKTFYRGGESATPLAGGKGKNAPRRATEGGNPEEGEALPRAGRKNAVAKHIKKNKKLFFLKGREEVRCTRREK